MSLSGFVVKQIALSKVDDSNPREAILRHAKVNCGIGEVLVWTKRRISYL